MRAKAIFLWGVVLTVCFSCSIQKRHYNGGYYIQWHKRYHSEEGKRQKEQPEDTLTEKVNVDSTVAAIDSIPAPLQEDPEIVDEHTKKHEKLPPLPKEERKFEPLGVLAAEILLLDIPVGILLDNTAANAIKSETQLGILFIAVLLVSFTLAIISMVRYLRNPKHYKFNIFAILVILFALFFLVEFLCGNLAITLKFSSLF